MATITSKTMQPVAKIDQQTPITVQVHAHLRRLILTLQIKPGEALSEKELSLKLGVSRTPVREAFIRLSEERLAARSIDKTNLKLLEDNLRLQQRTLLRKDYDALLEIDERFHNLLCDSVSLPRAWRMIHVLKGQIYRVSYLTLPEPGHGEQMVQQHTNILEAVRDGDEERAEQEMHKHLQEIWGPIERMVQDNNEIFQS